VFVIKLLGCFYCTGNGSGGESIYGGLFKGETLYLIVMTLSFCFVVLTDASTGS